MKTKVYLDMDGTIADLYNESNWLERLRAEEQGLFSSLTPFITEAELLERYPTDKYDIRILSMTPKGASKEYCAQVVSDKNIWLDRYFPSITNRIYLRYGYNKNLKNSYNAILIDDNATIRANYKGVAIAPSWL